jgi:hypothetical protein
MLWPLSFAAFSMAAAPASTIGSASEIFLPPVCAPSNWPWMPLSVLNTFVRNQRGRYSLKSWPGVNGRAGSSAYDLVVGVTHLMCWRRQRDGLMPILRRNNLHRWDWSANPQANATSERGACVVLMISHASATRRPLM